LWIDQQRNQHNMTQQEVVLSILDKAVEADIQLKLPLFSGQPRIVEKTVSKSLPFSFMSPPTLKRLSTSAFQRRLYRRRGCAAPRP